MNSKRLLMSAIAIALSATMTHLVTPNRVAKADDAAVKIVLNMDEYHFIVEGQQPNSPIELKAGQLYDMTITNTGKFTHEIWWGKDVLTPEDEGRMDGYKTNLLTDVPLVITGLQGASSDPFEINVPGLTEIAERPGQTFTIEFTLPDSAKGQWEIGCFQPMPKPAATTPATGTPVPDVPHYMVGMKASLIVK